MTNQEKTNAIWGIMIKQAIWHGLITGAYEIDIGVILAWRMSYVQLQIIAETPIPNYIKGGISPNSAIIGDGSREVAIIPGDPLFGKILIPKNYNKDTSIDGFYKLFKPIKP